MNGLFHQDAGAAAGRLVTQTNLQQRIASEWRWRHAFATLIGNEWIRIGGFCADTGRENFVECGELARLARELTLPHDFLLVYAANTIRANNAVHSAQVK